MGLNITALADVPLEVAQVARQKLPTPENTVGIILVSGIFTSA
jgi:hypothetical protein